MNGEYEMIDLTGTDPEERAKWIEIARKARGQGKHYLFISREPLPEPLRNLAVWQGAFILDIALGTKIEPVEQAKVRILRIWEANPH